MFGMSQDFQNYSSFNAYVHYENLSYYLYMNLKTHKIQQHFKQPQNILFLKYLRRPLFLEQNFMLLYFLVR